MARIIDVIQAPDQGLNQMVARVPQTGSGDFRIGSQVIVRESQAAVFFRDGKALDTFGPGRHTITTANIPLLVNLIQLGTSGQTPFTAEVYFVNQRDFIDMKWGTPEPISLRDPDLGLARLRANGRYSMAISDPQMFVAKIVGTQGLYQTSQIEDYLRSMIISRLTDLLGESKTGLFDLPGLFNEIERGDQGEGRRGFRGAGHHPQADVPGQRQPDRGNPEGDRRAGRDGRHRRHEQVHAVFGRQGHARGVRVRRRGGQRGQHRCRPGRGHGHGGRHGGHDQPGDGRHNAAAGSARGCAAAAPAATPDVMTVAEAAAYLKVSPADIQTLISSGQVKAKQIGTDFRISKKVLDDFLAS